jgi:hypothetical protein
MAELAMTQLLIEIVAAGLAILTATSAWGYG